MSTYTEVSNFQKTVRFFGPPCIYIKQTDRHSESELKGYYENRIDSTV